MVATYNPKSRIVVTVDEVSDDPFDATKRRSLGVFSANMVSCEWSYEPASGGIKDASIKLKIPRGTVARTAFDAGRFGVVSIYRANHLAELPTVAGFVDITENFDNNERSYFLFQGLAENTQAADLSDVVSFKVKGYGSWLKELEYTGTFTDAAIGAIFTAVMDDVVARSDHPIKTYATEDMTITSGVPDSLHSLHRIVIGERAYKKASVLKILKDLQDEIGGANAITFGVRCGATSDDFGEAYMLEWRGKAWSPDIQEDEAQLDTIAPVPYSRVTKYETEVDTSGVVNSVEVFGATKTDGATSYYGEAEAVASIDNYGRRHKVITNQKLQTDAACVSYGETWLEGRSGKSTNVLLSWSDEQTLNDSQRVGGSTLAKPYDVLHYMRDMNSSLHVTRPTGSLILFDGEYSDDVGIDSRPTAIRTSRVASGNPPVVNIDTTSAPFYGTSWGDANTFGHASKEVTHAQLSTTRSMLTVVRFGLKVDGANTGELDGQVLIEWSKRMRLKFVQSGGAGTNFGFTIETWRGGATGWVDELSSYGHTEILPHSSASTDGGLAVAIEIRGDTSTYPSISLWSSSTGSSAWQTLLATTNATDVTFGDATDHMRYADVIGQSEDFILVGAGSTSSGTSLDAATSGDLEIYNVRVYEGELNATSGDFEYAQGLDAEGSSTSDKDGSFLHQAAFAHLPRVEFDAGCLMSLEPSFKKRISGDDYFFTRWTRAQLNASGSEIYDGFSNDGYHAKLMSPQSGDGLIAGDDVTTATDFITNTTMRCRRHRVGSGGEHSKKLGDGVLIFPKKIKFKYAGEHSPLSISVEGGTTSDSLAGATSDALERIEETERNATASL